MSYEEKGNWVYLLVNVLTYGWYALTVLARSAEGPLVDVDYQSVLLRTIGISIVLSIVGRIFVAAVKPSDHHAMDARDKEINRLGEYVGGTVLAVAMIAPLAMTLREWEHFWIGNAMYAAFAFAAAIGTAIKLIAYRRGL